MNNTTKIAEIKALRRCADDLAKFHENYDTTYRVDSNCDKKGYGFGRDNRFCSFKIDTSFDSWRGYYGSSSCCRILSVADDKLVQRFFEKALNVHQRELFATAANLMREEAATLTDVARNELAALQALIDEAAEAAPRAEAAE